jgi:hypothetical protein
MLIRLDARRLTDAAALHAALAEAFGFPPGHGQNLDALVDSLTHLDNPTTARVCPLPGELAVLLVEHADVATAGPQLRALADAAAFANFRRLEKGAAPAVALAYQR